MQAKAIAEAHNVETSKAKALAEELKAQVEQAAEKAAAEEAKRAEEEAAHEARLAELQTAEKTGVKEAVTRLLQLIYFSKVSRVRVRTLCISNLETCSLSGSEQTLEAPSGYISRHRQLFGSALPQHLFLENSVGSRGEQLYGIMASVNERLSL